MINAKKRFEILKRDNFKCQYCGKTGKDVTLEVDHITPVCQGGDDSMENLVCSCRECNSGKGGNSLKEPAIKTYKGKLIDAVKELKEYFYHERNANFMGNIGNREIKMINILCNYLVNADNGLYYLTILDTPYIMKKHKLIVDNKINYDSMKELFEKGGEYCDDIIEEIIKEGKDNLLSIIQEVNNDKLWNTKTNYNIRLNYYISENRGETLGYKIQNYRLYDNVHYNG